MAICVFLARKAVEGGPVGPSRSRDAATGAQIATPKEQGETEPRTSLAACQIAPLPAFAAASPDRRFASVMPTS